MVSQGRAELKNELKCRPCVWQALFLTFIAWQGFAVEAKIGRGSPMESEPRRRNLWPTARSVNIRSVPASLRKEAIAAQNAKAWKKPRIWSVFAGIPLAKVTSKTCVAKKSDNPPEQGDVRCHSDSTPRVSPS